MMISRATALSFAAASVIAPISGASGAGASEFEISFAAGSHDATGAFMGGTELRAIVAHGGKLYAGNGYWMDRPGPEGQQGAQILVLDGPDAQWRVDQTFNARMPSGMARDFTVSTLREVTFATDGTGSPLPQRVSLLVVSNWDRTGTTRVFSRNDDTGRWNGDVLAQDRPAPNFLPQVRSFGTHRDRVTGIDHVFAGQAPRGVYRGSYDRAVASRIRWVAAPELNISSVGGGNVDLQPRFDSFAECNGRLYAAAGQQIFERTDGTDPHWQSVYSNPRPGVKSETGLRALTAIPNPAGAGEVLLATVEGTASRIVRFDPANGSEVTELDVIAFLRKQWNAPVHYVIAGYNDMTKTRDAQQRDAILIGLEAFVGPAAPRGHTLVNVGYGRLDGGGWYLLRHSDGQYKLHRIATRQPQADHLVSIRSIQESPFPGDRDTLYFAGYDANKAPIHNTAWIYRADRAAATA